MVLGPARCSLVETYERSTLPYIMAVQQLKIASGDWPGVALLVGLANGYLTMERR